jgi:hypothetical protein
MQAKNYYSQITFMLLSTYNTFYKIFSYFKFKVPILERVIILYIISFPNPH